MKHLQLITRAAVIAATAFWLSGTAMAVCGSVSASGTASNQNQALAIANAQGLQVTRSLDAQFGGNVNYKPAQWSCTVKNNGASTTCKITQSYCTSGGATNNTPSFNVDPNSYQCRKLDRKCKAGNNSACAKYENTCQND
ncbi:hypothetical protein [Aestuariivirga litoralis]|uniref:hypothetical protein n=1 Tax=Aestuariivirga litoralis TaxID=2650924 RepID=UPI0018C72CBD|nr:hypothetical protein [Aestuariivirga litoralis]MBG1233061.1 hypothetical protein [Aestuariivirga litoralis]